MITIIIVSFDFSRVFLYKNGQMWLIFVEVILIEKKISLSNLLSKSESVKIY